MPAWLEDIAGPGYAGAVMWTLVALVALGVIMLIVRIVRRVSTGSFSSSSGAYRARLAVMDAAEVDAQRRLVLVRRDEVEHLIMIGGPTDIVIEQNITGPGRSMPAAPADRQVAERPVARPAAERAVPVAPVDQHSADHRPAPVPVMEREPRAVPAQRAPDHAAPPAPAIDDPRHREPAIAQRVAASDPNVDEAMVSDFERDFRSGDAPAAPPQRRDPTIEDEMDRLLNEAPRERR